MIIDGRLAAGLRRKRSLGSLRVSCRYAFKETDRDHRCRPQSASDRTADEDLDRSIPPGSRQGELLLDHFFLVTSIGADVMPAADLLEHYRRRGAAEGLFGELMDTLAPTLSSAPRTRSVKKGRRKIPGTPTGIDAFARNEALLLLHMLAYEVLHTGRRVMEIVTGTGWSLRRFRETVLKVGARLVVHARRITMIVAQSATAAWAALWPKLHHLAWSGP